MKPKVVLGIETSCDECSVAVLQSQHTGNYVPISVATFSQIKLHQPYGGVVPEVASRNHLEQIEPMVKQALKDASITASSLDAIAVTNRPGLIGALLVGVTAAKALSYVYRKPLIAVHHLEGHLMSPFLSTDAQPNPLAEIQFPAIFLMASGGHTQLHEIKSPPASWSLDFLPQTILGRSVDDAAGEAFDKTAKTLGFPYPGGKYLDENARGGNRTRFDLPRGLMGKPKDKNRSEFDFSFSGLKTAVAQLVQATPEPLPLADLCASVQEAIVDALVIKTLLAVRNKSARSVVLVGGVAANSRLRERFMKESTVPVLFPSMQYCTDNAAMIAAAGALRLHQGNFLDYPHYLQLNAHSWAES